MQLFPKDAAGTSGTTRAALEAGRLYKVVFKTKEYFERTGRKCFYPWVEVRLLAVHAVSSYSS